MAGPGWSSEPTEANEGPVYPVSHFAVRYADDHPDLPVLGADISFRVELAQAATGAWVAPRAGLASQTLVLPTGPGTTTGRYHASAVGSIAAQLATRFQRRGLLGVYVAPHESDIELESERDLRRPGDEVLRLVVGVGRIGALRSVSFGDRFPPDWRIDHRAHRRIRKHSPLQPRETAGEGSTDLIRGDLLDDYLFRLNRHPGRRVDAALAPAEDGRSVTLDFRVSESRPWFVYGQVSDTGTEETSLWQQRYGFVHRQLSDRDDILSIEYMNAGLEDVNSVNLGYEAPFFSSERPRWLREPEEDGGWLAWLPRERIPWIGSDRLRWRVSAAWSRTESADVSETDDFLSKEWSLGGKLIYQAFQHRALFLDVFLGLRMRSIESVNKTLPNRTREYLWIPELGLELERSNEYSDLSAYLSLEGSGVSLDREEALFLGRPKPNTRWLLLNFDTGWSHFLEPLLNRDDWEDPSTPSSSKLAHELALDFRGQYAFNYRLIPQNAQVIGGLFSVRGYPQSEATGDTVLIGSLEYRYYLARSLPISRKPVRLPFLGSVRVTPQQVYGRADWDLMLRAFADAGRSFRNRRTQPLGPSERDETLVGAGVGIELQLGSQLRARLDWARSLKAVGAGAGRVDSGNDEFHLMVNLLY
jgi:hypothetical protein